MAQWVKDTIVPQVLSSCVQEASTVAARADTISAMDQGTEPAKPTAVVKAGAPYVQEASAVAARADTISAMDQGTEPDTRTPVIEAGAPYVQEASAVAARADTISAMDQGVESGKPQQSWRRALVTAGVLVLFISGALLALVLASPRTPVPPNTFV